MSGKYQPKFLSKDYTSIFSGYTHEERDANSLTFHLGSGEL